MTVTLRPFSEGDVPWLDSWLAPAAAASLHDQESASGDRLSRRLRAERRLRARIIERDGVGVGVLLYRLHAPRRGAAIIELVATPPANARSGSGMIAAALIEQELRSAGARMVYAPAAAEHGIAIYFWIRLGYRPLLRADWPCERPGVAWLRRDLGSSGTAQPPS